MTVGRTVLVVGAMAVLAGLDFIGSIAAKEYSLDRRPLLLLLGLGTFGVLFVVYALSLRYAELSIVTMGWIVLLQVGVLVLDQRRYGLHLHPQQWAAVVAIVVLQCYLVGSTTGGSSESGATATRAARPLDVIAGAHPGVAAGRAMVRNGS